MENIIPREHSLEAKIAAVLITIILASFTLVLAADILTIPQSGYLQPSGVEVYWDPQLTQIVTGMNWGVISPNHTYTSNVTYAVNISEYNITLSYETPNISPYLAESWNYTQATLEPNQVIPIEWYLIVSETAPVNTPVNWDLIVMANQT